MDKRKIVLDVETTGLHPNKGHKIIEIAAIELFDDENIGKVFHYYVNPERDIPEESVRIHGIDNTKVINAPIFKTIAKELKDFLGNSKIIAHNAEFDRSFINHEFALLEEITFPKESFIDTYYMAKMKFPNQKASLDDLCKKFNVSLESRKDYHGALIDIKLLAKVYYHLVKGQKNIFQQAGEDFQKAQSIIKNTKTSANTINFPYRKYVLSKEEEEQHWNFLNSIKDPLWKNNSTN